jgi:hypothetical protein
VKGTNGMDEGRLFAFLQQQEPALLIEVLQHAYHTMTTKQRQAVFGALVKQIPPSPGDGAQLQSEIHAFHQASLAGAYYAPFAINSQNFSDIPEETDAWFEQLGDFLARSTLLSDQGQHHDTCTCFGLLYALIEQMERGEEIVFAEEVGSWMIPGDEKVYLRAYISALAATTTPEDFAEAMVPLLRRDSYGAFVNKVYATAIRAANTRQKAQLKAAITRHRIKIKS